MMEGQKRPYKMLGYFTLTMLLLSGCVPMQPGNMRNEDSAQTISELKKQVQELQERNRSSSPRIPFEQGDKFILNTNDNEQATNDLIKFMKQNALDVTRYDKESIIMNYDGAKFFVQIKAGKGELSRVVVTKVYSVKRQYRNTIDILAYVIDLNRKINMAIFSLSDNSEQIFMQSHITFVDILDEKEIRKFLEFFNISVLAIIQIVPETTKYIE